jgi:hypothetical protein
MTSPLPTFPHTLSSVPVPSAPFPDLPGTSEGRMVYVAAFKMRTAVAYANAGLAKKAHADAEAQLAAVILALEAAKSSVASATELARDAIARFYEVEAQQLALGLACVYADRDEARAAGESMLLSDAILSPPPPSAGGSSAAGAAAAWSMIPSLSQPGDVSAASDGAGAAAEGSSESPSSLSPFLWPFFPPSTVPVPLPSPGPAAGPAPSEGKTGPAPLSGTERAEARRRGQLAKVERDAAAAAAAAVAAGTRPPPTAPGGVGSTLVAPAAKAVSSGGLKGEEYLMFELNRRRFLARLDEWTKAGGCLGPPPVYSPVLSPEREEVGWAACKARMTGSAGETERVGDAPPSASAAAAATAGPRQAHLREEKAGTGTGTGTGTGDGAPLHPHTSGPPHDKEAAARKLDEEVAWIEGTAGIVASIARVPPAAAASHPRPRAGPGPVASSPAAAGGAPRSEGGGSGRVLD